VPRLLLIFRFRATTAACTRNTATLRLVADVSPMSPHLRLLLMEDDLLYFACIFS
jgi:hypothetical protein